MGWLFCGKPKGMPLKQFFGEEFNQQEREGQPIRLTVLDCKATLTTAYVALERLDTESGKREVMGLVCLITHKGPRGMGFGYKDIDESMGPCESKCPRSILELLTPLDECESIDASGREWARAWRERCWDNIHEKARRAAAKREAETARIPPCEYAGRSRKVRIL